MEPYERWFGRLSTVIAAPATLTTCYSILKGRTFLETLRYIGVVALLSALALGVLGRLATWIYGAFTGKDLWDRVEARWFPGESNPFHAVFNVALAGLGALLILMFVLAQSHRGYDISDGLEDALLEIIGAIYVALAVWAVAIWFKMRLADRLRPNMPSGPLDDLAKLGKLRDEGVITTKDFGQKKRQLLSQVGVPTGPSLRQ